MQQTVRISVHHMENIDGLTDCITGYIYLCVDTNIPSRTVRYFPNNKPWITRGLKVILDLKKRALKAGEIEEMKQMQKELKEKIKRPKTPTEGRWRASWHRTMYRRCGKD